MRGRVFFYCEPLWTFPNVVQSISTVLQSRVCAEPRTLIDHDSIQFSGQSFFAVCLIWEAPNLTYPSLSTRETRTALQCCPILTSSTGIPLTTCIEPGPVAYTLKKSKQKELRMQKRPCPSASAISPVLSVEGGTSLRCHSVKCDTLCKRNEYEKEKP